MSSTPRGHVSPIAAGSGVVLFGLATAIAAAGSSLPGAPDALVQGADLAVGWAFAVVGTLLWLRYPDSRIGGLSVFVGFASFLADVRWFGTDLSWTAGSVLTDAHLVALAWLLLAFPSGRLAKFESVFVWALAGYYVVLSIAGHLFEAPVPGCDVCPGSLLLVRTDPGLSDAIWGAGQVINLAFVGVLAWLVVRRWREATPAARRALSPVMWALWPIGGAVALAFLESIAGFGSSMAEAVLIAERLALVVFPVALGVGVLRTRLDQARIGDLARRLDELSDSSQLEATIGEVLGDSTVTLGFWAPDGGGLMDVGGRPLPPDSESQRVTIASRDGEDIGVILCDHAVDSDLAQAVAATASLALRNESLRAELRRRLIEVEESRERIAEATVSERRKIERDLHDGAQQSLLALGASLGAMRAKADGPLEEQLSDAIDELRAIIDEVRTLARGVHPPILNERGLAPALEALAERAAVPVSVRVSGPRCRAAAEAAAYFLVAEAITNATRHADPSGVDVVVTIDSGSLRVTVSDDGRGGAQADPGGGIVGLQDRLAALGGALSVHSPPGGGSILEGVIPCE